MAEKTIICGSIGAVGSCIAQMLGGWDYAVQTLLLFMIVDCVLVFSVRRYGANPRNPQTAVYLLRLAGRVL